ncbi:glycosyltransferase [Lacibacterium aquatile]|uniref:Glycosyltransferase n=1 Tax=Lacibacterium aquatile TaxID=1168082 RepID=A0ABW5DX87_9PROT
MNSGAIGRQILRELALGVFSQFDKTYPGRGLDSFTGDASLDHPMAYALYASSAHMLGFQKEAEAACQWLCENALRPNGEVGWGLPFEWDAFADGSPNPVDTIYGITTALCVRALLDTDYGLPKAEAALENYLRYAVPTPHGLFFSYSSQPDDAKSVFNVTSMLAGQYARLGHILGRADFIEAAHAAAKDIIAHRQEHSSGYFWSYSTEIAQPNDSVHAAYTVQGLIELQAWLAMDLQVSRCLLYLREFFRKGEAFEFARHESLKPIKRQQKARLWGIGMLLHVACSVRDTPLKKLALRWIRQNLEADTPLQSDAAFLPRHQSHLVFGLARAAVQEPPSYRIKKPHIVSLTTSDVGNNARALKSAQAARKAGFRATIIGIGHGETVQQFKIDDIDIILAPSPVSHLKDSLAWPDNPTKRQLWLQAEELVARIAPLVDIVKPDLLHSHDGIGLRVGAAMTRRVAANGRPVFWIHDQHTGSSSDISAHAKTLRQYEHRYLRQVDRLISDSATRAAELQHLYHLKRAPSVIYDAPISQSTSSEMPDVRSALGLSTQDLLVILVGSVERAQDGELILKAVSDLPTIHLCLIGDSNHNDKLLKLARKLRMSERFHLFAQTPADQIVSFIRTADIGIEVCTENALPNNIFVYLQAGLPSAISDAVSTSEIVKRHGIGHLFEHGNIDSCKTAIQKALEEKSQLKDAITNELRQEYCWEHQAQKLSAIYYSLLRSTASSKSILLTSNPGAVAEDNEHLGIVGKQPPTVPCDFYFDPTVPGDRAGVLSMLALKYDRFIIASDAKWPSIEELVALRHAGKEVTNSDGTLPEMTLLHALETKQLAADTSVLRTRWASSISVAAAVERLANTPAGKTVALFERLQRKFRSRRK